MSMSREIKNVQKLHKIRELQDLVRFFIKPVPSDSNYVERHREYLKLEEDLDKAVQDYLEFTGKGRLGVNGKYF